MNYERVMNVAFIITGAFWLILFGLAVTETRRKMIHYRREKQKYKGKVF